LSKTIHSSTHSAPSLPQFHKRDIASLRNRPDALTRPDYICKFYPLLASLVLYHPLLERSSQEHLLQSFATGISSFRYRFCLETLTIAIAEMHETNAKVKPLAYAAASSCWQFLLTVSIVNLK
jgi:hypothetical protein